MIPQETFKAAATRPAHGTRATTVTIPGTDPPWANIMLVNVVPAYIPAYS
jgi:hypothetical protein